MNRPCISNPQKECTNPRCGMLRWCADQVQQQVDQGQPVAVQDWKRLSDENQKTFDDLSAAIERGDICAS